MDVFEAYEITVGEAKAVDEFEVIHVAQISSGDRTLNCYAEIQEAIVGCMVWDDTLNRAVSEVQAINCMSEKDGNYEP